MVKINIHKVARARVRSSSILEVSVALVILSLAFGVFMMIYMNVLAGSFYLQKLKYEGRLGMLYRETLKSKDFTDRTEEDGVVRIFRKVSAYKGNTDIMAIELKAIDQGGKILAEFKFLYYVSP
jgi:hypothetical protein